MYQEAIVKSVIYRKNLGKILLNGDIWATDHDQTLETIYLPAIQLVMKHCALKRKKSFHPKLFHSISFVLLTF